MLEPDLIVEFELHAKLDLDVGAQPVEHAHEGVILSLISNQKDIKDSRPLRMPIMVVPKGYDAEGEFRWGSRDLVANENFPASVGFIVASQIKDTKESLATKIGENAVDSSRYVRLLVKERFGNIVENPFSGAQAM